MASIAVAGCSASEPPAPETATVTKTVETTPTDQPNLECQAPAVTLDVTWRQDHHGEGIPPSLKPDEVVPPEYFEVYTLVRARAKITNLSTNPIYTRGIMFAAEWVNEKGEIRSTRYRYEGLIQSDVEYIPKAPPVASGIERGVHGIDGGDTIELTRDYYDRNPWNLRARVREIPAEGQVGPYTWVTETDWWFADKATRQRCHQK